MIHISSSGLSGASSRPKQNRAVDTCGSLETSKIPDDAPGSSRPVRGRQCQSAQALLRPWGTAQTVQERAEPRGSSPRAECCMEEAGRLVQPPDLRLEPSQTRPPWLCWALACDEQGDSSRRTSTHGTYPCEGQSRCAPWSRLSRPACEQRARVSESTFCVSRLTEVERQRLQTSKGCKCIWPPRRQFGTHPDLLFSLQGPHPQTRRCRCRLLVPAHA